MSVQRDLQRRVRQDKARPRFEPCLPRSVKAPPSGDGWLHEIKHDGFRIIGYRDANGARLITRNGYDFTSRFPLATAAVASLPVRSCVIDSEAIACDDNGLAVFEMIRWRRYDHAVTLCAFDLLELDGTDIRREPIEKRKRLLAKLLRRPHPGIALNEHYEGDGAIIYKHACALGCEGIVSKRRGSPYRAGRSDRWVKVKNPNAPAVRRLEEEEWH
jgi:bifunctional non-homologous end joining protein LigD